MTHRDRPAPAPATPSHTAPGEPARIDAAASTTPPRPHALDSTDGPSDLDWLSDAYRTCLRRYGHHHKRTLRAMHALADACSAADRPDEAVALRRTILAVRSDMHGSAAPTTVTARIDLARLLHQQAQCAEALSMMGAAVTTLAATLDPLDADLLMASAHYAVMLLNCGRGDEATSRLHRIESCLPYEDDTERREITALLFQFVMNNPGHLDTCTHRRNRDGSVHRPPPPPGLTRWADLLA